MAKKNKISTVVGSFDWVILVCAMFIYFYPQYSVEIPFVKFLMNAVFVFYNVSFTVFAFFVIIAVVMSYLFVYTDSLNDKLKAITAPLSEKGSTIKRIASYIKNFLIIFFCFEIGRKYAACLTIIFIICSTTILFIKDDMTAKVAKVALEHMNEGNKDE